MDCKPFLTCMSDIRGKRLERFEGRIKTGCLIML